eukprot:7350293-Ditylum_brightwellii.AAC.1
MNSNFDPQLSIVSGSIVDAMVPSMGAAAASSSINGDDVEVGTDILGDAASGDVLSGMFETN